MNSQEIAPRVSRNGDPPSSSSDDSDEEHVRCLRLRQQQLWAFKLVWSVKFVIIMYLILGVVLIPVGVTVLIQSIRMEETDHVRYDNRPDCNVGATTSSAETQVCDVPVKLERSIKAPAYLYYGLVNFYQNARNYITSRSHLQLRGEADASDLDECDPLEEFGNGTTIVPCGLTAASRFNDSFLLCRDTSCNQRIALNGTGIAWDIDREKRFQAGSSFTDDQNRLIESEDFMVWMRLAAYGNFHKLYRIIEEDLEAGEYNVRVTANFPVESFGGEKFFFISETRWFGGRNRFIGYAYIVVGGICLLLSGTFLLRSLVVRKRNREENVVLSPQETDSPEG